MDMENILIKQNEEYNGKWINDEKEGKGILKFKNGYYEDEIFKIYKINKIFFY